MEVYSHLCTIQFFCQSVMLMDVFNDCDKELNGCTAVASFPVISGDWLAPAVRNKGSEGQHGTDFIGIGFGLYAIVGGGDIYMPDLI